MDLYHVILYHSLRHWGARVFLYYHAIYLFQGKSPLVFFTFSGSSFLSVIPGQALPVSSCLPLGLRNADFNQSNQDMVNCMY